MDNLGLRVWKGAKLWLAFVQTNNGSVAEEISRIAWREWREAEPTDLVEIARVIGSELYHQGFNPDA